MKEYLLTPHNTMQRPHISPAHLVYKIENSHLYCSKIPLNLRGGLMVIGHVVPPFSSALISEIITECLRRDFEGLLIALPAVATDECKQFASELSSAFSRKNLSLHLPVTYSSCKNANFLIPGICSSGSFSQYVSDAVHDLGHISVELSLTSFKSDIHTGALTPMKREELNAKLTAGAMPFYSATLCTNYFTHNDNFILFDTPETLKIKRDTVKASGAVSCFYFISPNDTDTIKKLYESY